MKFTISKASKNKKWMMLILEILIVITIIGVLAALAMNTIGNQAWAKSRDAVRSSKLNEIATIVSALQNSYHVPPLVDWARSSYPDECKESSNNLYDCFAKLKITTSPEELDELFSDPKQWNKTKMGTQVVFEYLYLADTDWFKVCARFEDQWSLDLINANEDWKIINDKNLLAPTDTSANSSCIIHWDIRDIKDNPAKKLFP